METEYEEVALRQSFVLLLWCVCVCCCCRRGGGGGCFFIFVLDFRELLSDSQPWRKVCRQRNSLGALSPQLKRQ